MKIKTRPKHAGTLRMNGWLAGLRDGEGARPADPGNAGPCDPGPGGPGSAKPASYVGPVPADPGPRCQQSEAGSRACHPVVVQDRDLGLARAARIPAVPGADALRGAALPSSRNPGRAGRGYPPLGQAELEWHHDCQADEAHPRWQISRTPDRYIQSPVVALNPSRA